RSDLGGRQDRRRHLIEQRLKYVVVAAVDQDDLGIGVAPRGGRRGPRQTAPPGNDPVSPPAGGPRDRPRLGAPRLRPPFGRSSRRTSTNIAVMDHLVRALCHDGCGKLPFGSSAFIALAIRVCSSLAARAPF